jgi:aspartate aminotransferase-like enzyme
MSVPEVSLRLPGPTPVPAPVMEAMNRPMINHRGGEFKTMYKEILAGLGVVFGAAGDVMVFPSSGTGGLEAAIVNTLSPGDRVLAVSIGHFGDRFARVAADFGLDVVKLDFPWGQAADPHAVQAAVQADPTIKAVLITHNETSTGVTNDMQAIAAAIGNAGPLIMVDAVSSLAALPLPADDWGLDVVVTGSQKALMVPPGLGIVSVGKRAWQAHAKARLPRHYWDFTALQKEQEQGMTPYTPAVSLLYGLQASLRLIITEGLPNVHRRHVALADMLRSGLREQGWRLLADPAHASNTVTAVFAPEGMSGKDLMSRLSSEFNIVVGGGQGPYDGKIIRIGHMGWVHEADIRTVLRAMKAIKG